jgi:hypothetical protein
MVLEESRVSDLGGRSEGCGNSDFGMWRREKAAMWWGDLGRDGRRQAGEREGEIRSSRSGMGRAHLEVNISTITT